MSGVLIASQYQQKWFISTESRARRSNLYATDGSGCFSVMPAEAGIQTLCAKHFWSPAGARPCAGRGGNDKHGTKKLPDP
jgi:hypothetical protein